MLAPDKVPAPIWIEDDRSLAHYSAHWCTQQYVSIDTEFVRTSTFFPIAGLIQLADDEHCYLIDPLKISDWSTFAELLISPSVVKVFHACSEDLEVCQRLVGVLPAPVADTQVGAALASLGGVMGFQRLVKAVLDVELDKGETRSNWLQRPLSQRQIHYAVADVYYLHHCYPRLVDGLTELDRLSWWQEDCRRLLIDGAPIENFERAYLRVKLAWKLRRQEQYILQQLAIWREREARLQDVPRSRILEDNVLWNMARYQPQTINDLGRAGVRSQIRSQYAQALMDLIEAALSADESCWPESLQRPLSPQAGEWLKQLKKQVTHHAETLDIPADLLVKKKTLEALLRSGYPRGPYELPEPLLGWRNGQVAESLLSCLQKN